MSDRPNPEQGWQTVGAKRRIAGGNSMNRFQWIKLGAIVVVAGAITTEIGIRASGMVDFPIYDHNDSIGYIVRPNQSGRFLDKNGWAFNDLSMPIAESWNPKARPNLLLIGNSIIMGGNPYDQKDKVTPLLQAKLGDNVSVWPVAIGGWTIVNEAAYLEQHPDVAKSANYFIWEYMQGELNQLATWHSDYVFPSHKPLWATGYVLRRYVLPKFIHFGNASELPPTGALDTANLARFERQIDVLCKAVGKDTSGTLFLYPTKAQLEKEREGKEWLPERAAILQVAEKHRLRVVDLAVHPEWKETLYREGTHPTVEGNQVITKCIGGY
jgi:hypothetical protein